MQVKCTLWTNAKCRCTIITGEGFKIYDYILRLQVGRQVKLMIFFPLQERPDVFSNRWKKLCVHVSVSVSATGQNELENIVTSDIGRNPKLHIPDAKLFVVQHLNY